MALAVAIAAGAVVTALSAALLMGSITLYAYAGAYGPQIFSRLRGVFRAGQQLWRGGGREGGLNLFKWGDKTSTTIRVWKAGDRFLHLPNQGTPKLNWAQNASRLRLEMSKGKAIFDSYRYPNGNLIPTRGFLNAERNLLQSHDWWYNPKAGAWFPPIK